MFNNRRAKREAAEFLATLERAVKGNQIESHPSTLPKVQRVDAGTPAKHNTVPNQEVAADVLVSGVS